MTISAWADVAQRLEAGLLAIPRPKSYYIGRMTGRPGLPENILLFPRRDLTATNIPVHHHRHVLILALAGTGGVIIDRFVHHLQPGQAVLIQPHQLHHYADIQPPLLWLFATFEQDPGTWRQLTNRRAELAPDQEALISRLVTTFLDPRPEAAARLGLVLRLLLEELQEHTLDAPTASDLDAASGRLEVLERVNRILYARIEHPPGITALAEELGMSSSQLRLIIRRSLGLSLGQYMLRVRMSLAQILVADPTIRFGEVARRCGFASLQAFSRAFHRITGRSPSTFRKQVRQAPSGDPRARRVMAPITPPRDPPGADPRN